MRRVEARAAALVWVGLALGGCAATEKLIPSTEGAGSALANLLTFNTTTPGPVPQRAQVAAPLDCPGIEVLDGTAAYRTYAGADQSNGNVRYQFSMGEVARDCTKAGNQILLKVGVEGRVLLGPAGTPGSFTVPVRIAVRHDADGKPVATKFYQVSASIPAGGDATSFQLVSDPIAVPFITSRSQDDYTILVGFDAAGKTPTAGSPAAGSPAAGSPAAQPGRRHGTKRPRAGKAPGAQEPAG